MVIFIYNDTFKYVSLYNLLAEFFAIFGTLIYLELIQLNFCRLDYYLKKNIVKSGKKESNIDELYLDGDESSIY